MADESIQTIPRTITLGENRPVMFTRGNGDYDGWVLELRAPYNHWATVRSPDSKGWSLDGDSEKTSATIGCNQEHDHVDIIWGGDPEGEASFHTWVRGEMYPCEGSGGIAGTYDPDFSLEIKDGLVFLVEEESSTGIGVAVKIAAYRKEVDDYGEVSLVPVEVNWGCGDSNLVFLESVETEDGEDTEPGGPLDSDDMFQSEVWVQSIVEDTYTVTAGVEAIDEYDYSHPAYDLPAIVHVYDVALVVDANRDLKIDSKDVGKITEENPWRFWYNDDQDFKAPDAVSEFNAPGGFDSDPVDYDKYLVGEESVNVKVRDLTDFYPLHVDISKHAKNNMDGNTMATQYQIKLAKLDSSNISETLIGQVVFTDISPEQSGKYLSDVNIAEELGEITIDDDYRNYNDLKGILLNETKRSTAFLGDFIDNIIEGNSRVMLVQHAMKTGSNEDTHLLLEVLDSNANVTQSYSLPLRVRKVENMFSHIDLTDKVLDDVGYSSKSRYIDSEPENYPDDLTNDTRLVFVHGYNNNMYASRGANAENFKRLHLLGSQAKYIAVSWYGWESQTEKLNPNNLGYKCMDYQVNVYNALLTSFWLADALNNFDVSKDKTYLMAHSLGNMVVSSMIEDWWDESGNYEKYFMINAAVASESYSYENVNIHEDMLPSTWEDEWEWINHSQAKRVFLYAWHDFFSVADPRNEIRWIGRFEHVSERVKLYNFWSKGDKTFWKIPKEQPTLVIPPASSLVWTIFQWKNWFEENYGPIWVGKQAWARQEKLKGSGQLYMSNIGGWSHNPYWQEPQNPVIWSVSEQVAAENPYWGINGSLPERYNTAEASFPDILTNSGPAENLYFRNAMLASVVPAISLGAGGTSEVSEAVNIELEQGAGKWPVDDYLVLDTTLRSFWDHGHFQTIALPYVYHLYQRVNNEIK